MTYSAIRVRETPGEPRSGRTGVAVIGFGIAVAGWVSFGRHLFGIGGDLTIVYATTIGILFGVVFVLVGLAMRRTQTRGFGTRPITHAMLISSGVCAFLLGLMIPDNTPEGLQTIVSGPNEPALGIAIGIANPLGVIGIATGIIALVLAVKESRGRITLVESWGDDKDAAPAHAAETTAS
ncbi:Na+/H+ antiporter MnhB subunit-related protein domain-containing protein [Salinibacterium sp. NYA9b]